jgi:hypothetical protein
VAIFLLTLRITHVFLSMNYNFLLEVAQQEFWESAVPSHLIGMTYRNGMLDFCDHHALLLVTSAAGA